MKEKRGGRFQKLEFSPLVKIFRKPKLELKRFERLEVDGHNIKIEITRKIDGKERFVDCPKCKKRNPAKSLYCLYCSHIFESVAQEVEDTKIAPYQKLCPQCLRVCVRTQASCFYCGYRFGAAEKNGSIFSQGEESSGQQNSFQDMQVITLNIDNKVYRSSDPNVPSDIRDLMERIKRQGYSKETIDSWIRQRKFDRAENIVQADEEISAMRLRVFWRVMQVAVIIIIFVVFFLSIQR